ncbi:MAG: type II toxin-antitoxin system VapC family toxin [Gammaproteobacteria bacterium]|nr:type II toxin-antitoxin system VapC family toxin [Gammaproteobacteria bacterium]
MFLLDTNVVSELLRPSPKSIVAYWVENRQTKEMYFSAIGEAELLYGVAILPDSHRKSALAFAIDAILHGDFANRILPFDSDAAREYACIASTRISESRPMPASDCQIAAIARSRNMKIVTRNFRDYEGLDIDIVNNLDGEFIKAAGNINRNHDEEKIKNIH